MKWLGSILIVCFIVFLVFLWFVGGLNKKIVICLSMGSFFSLLKLKLKLILLLLDCFSMLKLSDLSMGMFFFWNELNVVFVLKVFNLGNLFVSFMVLCGSVDYVFSSSEMSFWKFLKIFSFGVNMRNFKWDSFGMSEGLIFVISLGFW